MIEKSFIHIKGVSREKEKELWKSGIYDWNDFLSKDALGISNLLKERIREELVVSTAELDRGNLGYFSDKLPRNQHWRMYPHLKQKCCFLDIETTGLSRERDVITIIGLYDGNECKIFIDGKNMHLFAREISKYDMVVTFNGACFDLPFIKNKHLDIKLPKFHIDLRYALKNLGYSGGLKKIEEELGLIREESIKDIDGFEAVRLWRAYKKGDKNALTKLIAYNTADIKNLKPLMEFAFENLCKECN